MSLESILESLADNNATEEIQEPKENKLPFRNEEPIVTSKLVNPADMTKSYTTSNETAVLKKPSLAVIISGSKKKPVSQCMYNERLS